MNIIDSSSLLTSQQRHAAAIAALDVEAPREVHVRRVAAHFAAVIVTRPDESSLVESFVVLATRYRLAGLGEATLEALGERIERIVHDTAASDESSADAGDLDLIQRTIERVLNKFSPAHERCSHDAAHKHVQIAGHWLPGETLVIDQQRFELTGSLCPQCGLPSAHAPHAVRCVDEIGCCWMHDQAADPRRFDS